MNEAWSSQTLIVFDGAVLELFGLPSQSSVRFHVRNLDLSIDPPGRNGDRWVVIRSASGSGAVQLEVSGEDWQGVGPLLDRVLAAMPD